MVERKVVVPVALIEQYRRAFIDDELHKYRGALDRAREDVARGIVAANASPGAMEDPGVMHQFIHACAMRTALVRLNLFHDD